MKVGLRSKWKFGLLSVGLLSVGLLIGCSAEAENGSAVETDAEVMIPEGVENGTISQEFYNDLVRFEDEGEELENKGYELFIKLEALSPTEKDLAISKEAYNYKVEHDDFLDSFDFNPSTKADEKLAAIMQESIEIKKEYNSYIDILANKTVSNGMFPITQKLEDDIELNEQELYELMGEYKLELNN